MLSSDYVKQLGYDSEEAIVGQTVTLAVKQEAKCLFVSNPEDCIATVDATVTGVQAPGVLSSFSGGARVNPVLNNALYKLQAIMKSKFGLNAKSYLCTQSIIKKETPLTRAKEFGIEIVDGSQL